MTDKNGKEMRTGDIVVTSGAYLKNDNARWVIVKSPGDAGWSGKDYCIYKLNKNNTISKSKYRTGFWPIMVCTNSFRIRCEAKGWNDEHAEIEVTGHMEIPKEAYC